MNGRYLQQDHKCSRQCSLFTFCGHDGVGSTMSPFIKKQLIRLFFPFQLLTQTLTLNSQLFNSQLNINSQLTTLSTLTLTLTLSKLQVGTKPQRAPQTTNTKHKKPQLLNLNLNLNLNGTSTPTHHTRHDTRVTPDSTHTTKT